MGRKTLAFRGYLRRWQPEIPNNQPPKGCWQKPWEILGYTINYRFRQLVIFANISGLPSNSMSGGFVTGLLVARWRNRHGPRVQKCEDLPCFAPWNLRRDQKKQNKEMLEDYFERCWESRIRKSWFFLRFFQNFSAWKPTFWWIIVFFFHPTSTSPGTRFKGNLEVELGSQDREDLQAIQDWWRSGGFPKEDL